MIAKFCNLKNLGNTVFGPFRLLNIAKHKKVLLTRVDQTIWSISIYNTCNYRCTLVFY